MNTYFSKAFWLSSTERALKTVAQALLGLFLAGQPAFDVFSVDPKQAVGVAVGAAVLSYLTSIVSSPAGEDKGQPNLF